MTAKKMAAAAALAGLNFYVERQNADKLSADCGRFYSVYNVKNKSVEIWTSNWRTGVLVAAMLSGYQFSKEEKYFNAARLGIGYIKSLQNFAPEFPRLYGAIREDSPQFVCFHPRDAITAALALLDWHRQSGDEVAKNRVEIFAKWFMEVGMEKGWPYWTARFDDKPWEPTWCGSFHSGSAYTFYRLFELTGKSEYKEAMEKILEFYNSNHLNENGEIAVMLDRNTGEILDGKTEEHNTDALRKWEIMHQYNDDFGALANLAAFKLTGKDEYRNAVRRFMRRMVKSQREDGGFGPQEFSVPSASGMILIEVYAAKSIGLNLMTEESINSAVKQILSMQMPSDSNPINGLFMDDEEHLDCRTTAYSIMALLRYAGASDFCYSL